MKKVLSIIFTIMLALGASAQNTHDIIVWHGTKSETIQAVDSITFIKSEEKATYIDLGLSVKWGTCNIGAKNPEILVTSISGETLKQKRVTIGTPINTEQTVII